MLQIRPFWDIRKNEICVNSPQIVRPYDVYEMLSSCIFKVFYIY